MTESNFVYCINEIKRALQNNQQECSVKTSTQYRNLSERDQNIIRNMYRNSFPADPNKYVDPRDWFNGNNDVFVK
jgi:hypothetical protein